MAPTKVSLSTLQLQASLSMGFRPLYLLASLWAIVSVSLWVFAPELVKPPLAGMYWHAHEMLWGFVCTIAVGFLLTASATWTGINPLYGRPLALLCLIWIGGRVLLLVGGTSALLSAAALDSLFFLFAAVAIGRSVVLSKNWRNLVMPFLLCFLAASQFVYLYSASTFNTKLMWQSFNIAWVVMALISLLIGSRVIPFFTGRGLSDPTVPLLAPLQRVLLVLGAVAVTGLSIRLTWLTGVALSAAALIVFYQLSRWYRAAMWQESLLWVLHIGYACIGMGLFSSGLYFCQDVLGLQLRLAIPIHTIGVAGFGILIIGMLVRTSQGHLGLALAASPWLRLSFYSMILCAALRVSALWPSSFSVSLMHLSTLFWILSLGIYIFHFSFRLLSPRPSGTLN
ncbi:NnrS family protein [Paenalcaligenes niemegkensis]|uniref:NnrS family protein n=1 Tax=Paenalcaligenes niemegkensis TaxID=2895469 RepID=UPI001EE9430F|nr:NnrS family protein [Paenalcaligenes niemegkensis]MCQ9617220.1 NnrS family protein [Paenalcaligenes niemegkensis]